MGLALAHRAALASEHDSHVIAGLALLHVGEAHAMLGVIVTPTAAIMCRPGRRPTGIIPGLDPW